MCLHFRFVLFWGKNIGAKGALKMLVKLDLGINFNHNFFEDCAKKPVHFTTVQNVSVFVKTVFGR
jgi:hypothetical protein